LYRTLSYSYSSLETPDYPTATSVMKNCSFIALTLSAFKLQLFPSSLCCCQIGVEQDGSFFHAQNELTYRGLVEVVAAIVDNSKEVVKFCEMSILSYYCDLTVSSRVTTLGHFLPTGLLLEAHL
jgi:hypothetical protein